MRVLLLNDRIPPENRGGAGEVFWRLALGLRSAGHEVHVIAATERPSFNDVRAGIQTYHLHSSYPLRWRAWLSLYNPQTVRDLRRLYQQIQPDVVHAHNVHTDLSYHSLTIADTLGIPTVFTSHDVMLFAYHKMSYFIDPTRCDHDARAYRLPPLFNLRQMRLRYNPLRNLTIRRILRRHTRVRTAPSQALCDAHHANDLPSFVPVPNGIDVDAWQVAGATVTGLRQRLGLEGRKVILFAGRLTNAKGTYQLLDALDRVRHSVPDVTLLVLSSRPIEDQIRDPRYTALRDTHIMTGGWLSGDELAAAYQLARVVAVPSIIFDTFPTVNLEAMATATPVLASCYGGSREAVIDGETGYIINPFDTDDLTATLRRLLRDDDLCQQMGTAGYARVTTHFTLAQHVQRMLGVYQQAQAHRP
jgi:glycosyltransferase involved in cell wall biosynthesis